jgi:hypothetical protein
MCLSACLLPSPPHQPSTPADWCAACVVIARMWRRRQFSTIMASYHGFGSLNPKPFGWPQQMGTALVFSGILLNLSFKQRSQVQELWSRCFGSGQRSTGEKEHKDD